MSSPSRTAGECRSRRISYRSSASLLFVTLARRRVFWPSSRCVSVRSKPHVRLISASFANRLRSERVTASRCAGFGFVQQVEAELAAGQPHSVRQSPQLRPSDGSCAIEANAPPT